jgi:hypothetical protein
MATDGTATIDFGATPGGNAASVVVTGQAAIVSGSFVEAWIAADTSADHNAEEHALVASYLGLACGAIAAGTGFTVFGRCDLQITGQWSVRWCWA